MANLFRGLQLYMIQVWLLCLALLDFIISRKRGSGGFQACPLSCKKEQGLTSEIGLPENQQESRGKSQPIYDLGLLKSNMSFMCRTCEAYHPLNHLIAGFEWLATISRDIEERFAREDFCLTVLSYKALESQHFETILFWATFSMDVCI